MKHFLVALALLCSVALEVSAQSTDAASDRVVVVGNPGQPVQWNHRGNIQEAITRAKPNGTVIIPSSYTGTDCSPISNCNPGSVIVIDWRTGGGSSSLACGNSAAVYIFNGTATICDPHFLDDGNGNVTVTTLTGVGLTISGSAQFILGARLGPTNFSSLPSAADGTLIYCPDCQALNPCLGGGTGAFAQRVNATWLCATGGGGGGSTTPSGPNTAVQVNDNGVMNGFLGFTFNKNTSTLTFPDGSAINPSGLFPPTPTTNSIWHVDSSAAQNHAFTFRSPTNGQVCLQGGGVGFSSVCVAGDTYLGIPPIANLTAGDAVSHYTALNLYSFGNSHTDQLGYVFANGGVVFSTDLNPLPGCVFCVDRVNKSAHFYGGWVLPDGAGTGNSYGVLGAIPVSQGNSTPVKWSSDLTGPLAFVGSFGSCAGVTVTGSQSGLCWGPSGHLQASWAGDTFQDLVRANNIPAAGITGLIAPSQLDLTNPGGLGGVYAPLNPVAQYNIPEWGAANVGPVTGPFNDAADNIVTAAKLVDLGTTSIGSDYANCAATGTTLNKLVKLSSSAGATCAVIASIADTQGEVGVCVGRCGTTGSAVIAYHGKASLVMDGATTVNDWVINSPSVAGDGRDTGSTTCPTSGAQVIGRVLSTNGATGTYTVQLGGCDTTGGGGGGGGTPGGANGQGQYNNAGAFGGYTVSGDGTLPFTTGVLTITGINGTAFAGTNGDCVKFGASNIPADCGFLASNIVRKDAANTAGASMTLDMTAASATTGLILPSAAGASPTAAGSFSYDTTTNTPRCGNGTTTTRCVVEALISGGGGGQPTAAAANFVKIMGGSSAATTTEASTRLMLPFAGTVTNLCVTWTTTQSANNSLVVTLRDSTSATDSALTITIAAGATANTLCDTTHSATITAQHDYVLKFFNNANVVGAAIAGVSAVYTY